MEHSEDSPRGLYSMSPVSATEGLPDASAIPAPPGYKSPGRRARWTLILLMVMIGVELLELLALGSHRSLLDQGPGQITQSEWEASTRRLSDLWMVEMVVLAVTGVVFLRWLHRCYRNLIALGSQGLRFTPGWAVGYWFVPILNLIRPKQILDELWRETSPADRRDDADANSTPLTALWLTALLTAVVSSRIGFVTDATSVTDLKHQNDWMIVSTLGYLAATGLIYCVVRSLTARQQRRVLPPG